jgi:hypothetical protein
VHPKIPTYSKITTTTKLRINRAVAAWPKEKKLRDVQYKKVK